MDNERFYRSLYKIRRVEEEIVRIYPTDKIKSPVHLSIGQEAVSVGVCEALTPSDVVFGTYRSHALYLAKGGDMNRMIAELYGKVTGCAKGKGGSMHLIDTEHGVMGTSAMVGTTIPEAVGYAYALKVRGESSGANSIVASFFGDGAVDEGVFYESLNFAKLKEVPIIFICENNRYSIHSHQKLRQPSDNICERVRSFGIPAERIEGNDVLRIYEKVSEAVEQVRSDHQGPKFFECMTYRWKEHVGPGDDFDFGFRDREEAEPWFQSDQVQRLGGMLDGPTRQVIERSVDDEIIEAFRFAEQSEFPNPQELYTDVFTIG
jgi:TPP-dependent pyruvate/acetoin dehydrogenase alpha subunit